MKLILVMITLSLTLYAGEKLITTKMGKVEIQKVHEYEHWLLFNGKRIQKFEERYVTFKQHYESSSKTIIILNIDTGTSMVKPEYAIIELRGGNIYVSNRIISYDYTFKIIKATTKKIIMNVGLSDNGAKRIATYKNGKISVAEKFKKFNAITSKADIATQKRAIHAHLGSFIRNEDRLEGYDIEASDGNLVIYKKDNFDVKYVQATLYTDGTTNKMKLYFKDNKAFYAQENFTYSAAFAEAAGVPASQNDIKEYYFFNGKLARVEDNSGYVATSDLGYQEKYINKIANAIVNRNVCDQ